MYSSALGQSLDNGSLSPDEFTIKMLPLLLLQSSMSLNYLPHTANLFSKKQLNICEMVTYSRNQKRCVFFTRRNRNSRMV